MGRDVDERIARILDAAEARRACLAPTSAADKKALRRRKGSTLAGERIVSPAPGIYARESYLASLDSGERARSIVMGLAELHPDWVFCSFSAALVWELPLSWGVLRGVHIANECLGKAERAAGLVRHDIELPGAVAVDGVKVTGLLRTAYDCMRGLSFCDALAIADATLRRLGISAQEAAGAMRREFKGCRGIRRVVDIMLLASPLAESGGESIARGVMMLEGFAEPALQFTLGNGCEGDGEFRVDFAWRGADGTPIFGELDGKAKYVDPAMTGGRSLYEVHSDERLRESRLTAYGAKVCRFKFSWLKDRKKMGALFDLFGVPRGRKPNLVRGVPHWSLHAPWSEPAKPLCWMSAQEIDELYACDAPMGEEAA